MTRETRIGLLVGLLFIITFGLVLSELTGTGAGPPAPAAAEESFDSYAHTPVIRELAHPIGYAEPGRNAAAGDGTVSSVPAGGRTGGEAAELTLRPGAAERGGGGIVEADIRQGTTVLAATEPPDAPRSPESPDSAPPAPARPEPRRRVYKVQADDNLIRIARKVYGRGHEQSYKVIYNANLGILPDEATVYIGQELVIPPLPGASSPAAPSAAAPPARAASTPPALAREVPAAGSASGRRYVELTAEELARRVASGSARRTRARKYMVRRGDSLTNIARRLMRDDSPAAVRKLYNANRDRLGHPDSLPVGVELMIPS